MPRSAVELPRSLSRPWARQEGPERAADGGTSCGPWVGFEPTPSTSVGPLRPRAPARIRTWGPGLRRTRLYPLSYRGVVTTGLWLSYSPVSRGQSEVHLLRPPRGSDPTRCPPSRWDLRGSCPAQDSNLDPRLRRPVSCPLDQQGIAVQRRESQSAGWESNPRPTH